MADYAPEDATDDNLGGLLELTSHPESDTRAEAARGIKLIAEAQPDLVADRLPAAIGLLHSHDSDVRTFGQDVIRILGSERPEVLAGPKRPGTSHRG